MRKLSTISAVLNWFASIEKGRQLTGSRQTPLFAISLILIGFLHPLAVVAKASPSYSFKEKAPYADIPGRVSTTNGDPVAGATVAVKGTSRKAFTDDNGRFVLRGVNAISTIVITGANIETLEVTTTGTGELNITVQSKITALGEVEVSVNTGYQKISRERVTGSFNVIGREQLEKPTINIAQRLIGTTAGMQAKLDVNGNPTFEIRGLTSLYANAQPLVIVDGFALYSDVNTQNLANPVNPVNITNPFNSINPNDIESVTVLKDAAAASIWGAKSANGVIVITTRNGKKGVPLKVEASAFTTIGSKFDLDYVNPLASSALTVDYEKRAFNNWSAQINSGALASNFGKSWSLATVAMSENNLGYITLAQRDSTLAALSLLSNKSQIKDELLANPTVQQYNISLFGSSARMTNALSMLFEKSQSNFKGTDAKRVLLNYRTSASVFKWLDFSLSAFLQYVDSTKNGLQLQDIQGLSPYDMLKNPDGSLTNISQYYWPIMQRFVPMGLFPYSNWTYNPIQEINSRKLKSSQINARVQAGLNFHLAKGLNFESKIQYEMFNLIGKNEYTDQTFQVRRDVNQAATWDAATNKITANLPKGSFLEQARNQVQTYNFRNQLNFARSFGSQHEVNIVAGTETSNILAETYGNPRTYGYNNESLTLGTFPNGPGGTFFPIRNWMGSNQVFNYVNTFASRTERYFSFYGNASYTYNNKYTLSGSYRTDASNLITDDPKYRYAPLWSVGAAWQAGKENFMSSVTWLDRLNFRLTYGYNGNVDRSTAFMPLIATSATPNTYTNDFTANISSFGNPALRWEKTGSWNFAVDYSLFRSKLYGRVEVYNKAGKDLIATLSIPAVNGTTTQKLNNAAMSNRGIEVDLGTALHIKGNKIVWRGNVNFSYNKNKITDLFVATYAASTLYSGGTGAYVVGENASSLWRFQYAGVINKQPMVMGAKGVTYDFGAFTPGDGRDYLLNVGPSIAPYTLGFVNGFQIYDFNLSFIVTGKFGHVFQRTGFNYPPTWTTRVLPNKKLSDVLNGDMMQIVPLPLQDVEPRYYFWDRFHQYLSYLIENASHIRMQEINLSYDLKRPLLSKYNISRAMIYAQANDLFTVVANKVGEDPEYPLGMMNPRPRLTFGIKCEF